jgi:tetratricopeptide (TPR) repeat protein
MDDQDRAQRAILEFYYGNQRGLSAEQKKNRIPLAELLTKTEDYSQRAWWIKAEFHKVDRKYREALQSYRMADNPPANLWKIVECFLGLKQHEQAVQQLFEIENFFKADASRAALKIAHVYRGVGDKPRQIASLRRVMKKYPGSRESSSAHVELERLGVTRIDGGEDAS